MVYSVTTSKNPLITPCSHLNKWHDVCLDCNHGSFGVVSVYLIGFLVWVLILFYLEIEPRSPFEIIFILIPVVLFAVAIWYAGAITPHCEAFMLKDAVNNNLLTLALPIFIAATSTVDDCPKFLRLILFAAGLSFIGYYDVWISDEWLAVVKHLRSICQVMAISLLLLAVIQYYRDRVKAYKKSGSKSCA